MSDLLFNLENGSKHAESVFKMYLKTSRIDLKTSKVNLKTSSVFKMHLKTSEIALKTSRMVFPRSKNQSILEI